MNVSSCIDLALWDIVDPDCLLLAIEQSARVRTQPHFFSWTQGVLQTLVPHELMFCATFGPKGEMLASEVLSHIPPSERVRETIMRAETGLLCELLRIWECSGRAPLLIGSPDVATYFGPGLVSLLAGLGIENAGAHGSYGTTGVVDTFVGFAHVGKPLDARLAVVLEAVLPHLRAALIQTQARRRGNKTFARRSPLTEREAEILGLLQQGLSNSAIGTTLTISPLTVKNHVQKILRKLGVRNRTQAVALELSRNRNE